MTVYSGQLLRVDQATGETTATFLTVTDDDDVMQSAEAGTVYNLCGTDMAAPPVLDLRKISGTLLDGSAFTYTVAHFAARGKDFYILPASLPPEAVGAVTASLPRGPATPQDYFSLGQTVIYGALRSGPALAVQFDTSGAVVSTTVTDALVTDGDDTLQNGGGVYDGGAEVMFGPDFTTPLGLQDTDRPARQMVLVRVFYDGVTQDGSFVALRVTEVTAQGTTAYYLPRTGQVDLSDVAGYLRERLLKGSAEGMTYADFGLTDDLAQQTGGAAADFLRGTVMDDALIGNGGDDWLVGGLSADRLDGGTGNDALHGGAQDDTLLGGLGNDALYGGNDNDNMLGGLGDDTFLGAWGEDTLYGGDGNDRVGAGSDNDAVYGGAGDDSVIGFEGEDLVSDGTGVDTLNGGQGADTFVLATDGSTDRILDFEDGLDRIDLAQTFASLTITTLGAGRVQVLHGGEMLLIDDPTRQFTAADLTAADFL